MCTKIVSVCWENRTNENERTLLYFEPCSCCHCPEQTFVYSKTSKLQKKKSKIQRHKGYCIICIYSRFWMEVQSQQRLATTWTMETSGQSWFLVHLETNNCNQEENNTLFDDNHKMHCDCMHCMHRRRSNPFFVCEIIAVKNERPLRWTLFRWRLIFDLIRPFYKNKWFRPSYQSESKMVLTFAQMKRCTAAT